MDQSAYKPVDPDADGRSNIQEHAAGTNPNNRADFLRILTITKTAGACTLTAPGRAGRGYTLEHTANAAIGPWLPVASFPVPSNPPLATDGQVSLTDPSDLVPPVFYRIRGFASLTSL